jgi:predicted TIM-barrel fold metal-dependent hydrolase
LVDEIAVVGACLERIDGTVRRSKYFDIRRNFLRHTRKPSDYLKNVYYDTCLYDPTVLSALIKIVGPDRLLLGADWPLVKPIPWVS